MHFPGAMMSTSPAVVAEVGVRVVAVVRAPRVAQVAAEGARLAIGVGEGRDRDDLVVGGRYPASRAHPVVARGGNDGDPAIDHAADRQVQDVPLGSSAIGFVVAALRDAHVRRLDQRSGRVGRIALGEHPVQAADVPGQQAVAVVVQDLDRPQADARRNADDAGRVVLRADGPGDMRAVALDVAPCAPRGRSSSCSRRRR